MTQHYGPRGSKKRRHPERFEADLSRDEAMDEVLDDVDLDDVDLDDGYDSDP